MQLSKHNLHFKFSAPLLRGVETFWSWWISELGGMLPPGARRVLLPRAQRLFLELDGTAIVMSQGTAQTKEELTRYLLDQADAVPLKRSTKDTMQQQARELVLCLPRDKVLTRSLTLPLEAEENLREVLSFEMDRQTPFTAEQVYYDFSVVARSAAERTLTVDLVLVTRRMLDELLARLDNCGLHPDLVSIKEGERARDSYLAQDGLSDTAIEFEPRDFNCRLYGPTDAKYPVLWCPHGKDYNGRGKFYPHTWPPDAGQAVMAFLRGLPEL